MKHVLVLGGAGFCGSNIASRFVDGGWRVTVIDGLLARTGGSVENLAGIAKNIQFIRKKIESVANLPKIIDSSDLIVDSMSWSAHRSAFLNPLYDLRLNLLSHLKLIENLRGKTTQKVIFLGTRSQYGRITGAVSEDAAKIPVDVQGINKEAAESYFRIYSNIYGFDVASVRFGNTMGVNMRYKGDDIGLVGSIVRDLLLEKQVKVYKQSFSTNGKNHMRTFLYVWDLSEVVYRLASCDFRGFVAFNLNGQAMTVLEFVKKIIKILGKGKYKIEKMPEEILRMNVGDGSLSQKKLAKFIGKIPETDFEVVIKKTLDYYKSKLKR